AAAVPGSCYKRPMTCPKCGHQQDDTVKCAACGIYFSKFQRPASPRSKPARPQEVAEPGIGPGALVVTALITGAAVFYFMRGSRPAAPQPTDPFPAARVFRRGPAEQPVAPPGMPAGAAGTQAANPHPGNPTEAAQTAPVFIRTGGGS